MVDEGQGPGRREPKHEAEGPLGDDLDALFVEQMRPASSRGSAPMGSAARAQEPHVRQRGTLPGRLSPARFSVRFCGAAPAHELALGAGHLWALGGEADAPRIWRMELSAGSPEEQPALADASPISLAAGADRSLYLGDTWRGAYRISTRGELGLLPTLEGPKPVGALRLSGDAGQVLGLDGLGRLYTLSPAGLRARPEQAAGRVVALASAGHLCLLLHDDAHERLRLRRGAVECDLGPWLGESAGRCSLLAGAGRLLVLGATKEPLWLEPGSRGATRLRDLGSAHAAAWLSLSGEPALLLALRERARDVISLRRGEADALVLDLAEPFEDAAGTERAPPRRVHALVSDASSARVWLATDTGILELQLGGAS